MMQAGKDYIAKGDAEPESARSVYLRELLQAMNVPSTEPEEKPAAGSGEKPAKPNQNKPTLKLTK
jgi:hypothetical protein